MQCDVCRVPLMPRRTTAVAPYRYRASGLPNVWLIGIEVRRCPLCAGEAPVIPCMGPLHGLIAEVLIERPGARTGAETRYLRKVAGMDAESHARLLAMDAGELAEIEDSDDRPGERITLRFSRGAWHVIQPGVKAGH